MPFAVGEEQPGGVALLEVHVDGGDIGDGQLERIGKASR